MQTKKEKQRKTVCRETLCICLRRWLHELLYIPLFSRRRNKNGRESDVTAKKMCWWIQLCKAQKSFTTSPSPARKSMMSRTQSDSHSTYEAHCRKKVGQSGDFARKRWNSVWKLANSEKTWPFRALIVGSSRRIRPKRGGLARHSWNHNHRLLQQTLKEKKKDKWSEWSIRWINWKSFIWVQRCKDLEIQLSPHKRARGPAEVSRGPIEVLTGGPSCCFQNKGRLRWTDWWDYSHHTGWLWLDPCIPNTGPD